MLGIVHSGARRPGIFRYGRGIADVSLGLLVISHLASTLHKRASDVDMMHNCRYCFWGAIATQSLVPFPNTRSTTYTSGLPEFRPYPISGMKTTLYNLKPTFNPRICVWTPLQAIKGYVDITETAQIAEGQLQSSRIFSHIFDKTLAGGFPDFSA